MEQRPTVLVRIYGDSRDKLRELAHPKFSYFATGPKEALAETLERLLTASSSSPVVNKKARARRKRKKKR